MSPEWLEGMETKFEEMLEMRIEGKVLCLCCTCLLLPPRLRICLVAGLGLGHLASRALVLRAVGADALPELWHATLQRKLHKGRMLVVVVALRRLVVSQCGRRLETEVWSERLREGGLRHLKPTPLQVLQVIQGKPHPQSNLVFMEECGQSVHRMPVALLSTKRLRERALMPWWHLGHASSNAVGTVLVEAQAKPPTMYESGPAWRCLAACCWSGLSAPTRLDQGANLGGLKN